MTAPTSPTARGRARLIAWWVGLAAVGATAVVLLAPGDDGFGGGSTGTTGTTVTAVVEPSPGGTSAIATDDTSVAVEPDPATTASDPAGGPTTTVAGELDDDRPNTATTAVVDEAGCLPGYAGACLPPPPPTLTCADIAERDILVTGPDPHGLDADGDGTACPSDLPPATTAPGTPPDPLD